MTNKTDFAKMLDKVGRLVESLNDKYLLAVTYSTGDDMELRNETLINLQDTAEKLVLLTRALPEYTGNPRARDEVAEVIRENVPVEIGYTMEGWFYLNIPALLPSKKQKSTNYVRSFLFPAMADFFWDMEHKRYPKSVIIFRHIYGRDRPGRRKRDHDNVETKMVTDIVALYVLPDDSPDYTSLYECSVMGDTDQTEVYVVPENEFGKWLLQKKNIPEQA